MHIKALYRNGNLRFPSLRGWQTHSLARKLGVEGTGQARHVKLVRGCRIALADQTHDVVDGLRDVQHADQLRGEQSPQAEEDIVPVVII